MRRKTVKATGTAELKVAVEKVAGTKIHVDVSELKPGTYVWYNDLDGVIRTGLISELANKTATIQSFWNNKSGQTWLLREDTVPIAHLREIIGQRKLPVVTEKEKTVRIAPVREGGYKTCEREKCNRAVYGVIRTEALHRTIKGFKFGNIDPGEGLKLVALCSKHYKDRLQYGLMAESWTSFPKPTEESSDAVVETPGRLKNTLQSQADKSVSTRLELPTERILKLRKDGKVDGRSLRWKKMTPEERKSVAKHAASHKRKH